MIDSILKEWDNFYVITGSSAAGLTGLTFVVIALTAETKRANNRGLRAYVTPIVVHFGTVLALAAFLSMPHLTAVSLSVAFGVVGAGGVAYGLNIAAHMGRISREYSPVAEDWIWNMILPVAAYGTLLAGAYFIWHRPEECMYAVAGVSVALMCIGIHNSWDIAVWNTLRKPNESRDDG
jgi:hypothetical protein